MFAELILDFLFSKHFLCNRILSFSQGLKTRSLMILDRILLRFFFSLKNLKDSAVTPETNLLYYSKFCDSTIRNEENSV